MIRSVTGPNTPDPLHHAASRFIRLEKPAMPPAPTPDSGQMSYAATVSAVSARPESRSDPQADENARENTLKHFQS
jgi:hypothetical protein